MIRTGVYDISQLIGSTHFRTLFGRERVVSVTLYDQILDSPNADALAERILLLFSDERGAFKRTYAQRFEVFDSQLLSLLTKHFNHQEPLIVADVAVSDGRTACDLFERIAPHYPRIAYYASDYGSQVRVLRQGRLAVTLSRNNRILEIVWPPFVFSIMRPEPWHYYPLNRVIQFLVWRFLAEPLRAKFLAGRVKANDLHLFSVRALNLSRKGERFHLVEQNILETLATPEPVHVVRAMNVLNTSYIGRADLCRILGNFNNGLREGGWLVVGYNEGPGSTVNGGIYRKTGTGFEKLWQSGNGPQMEADILSWKSS
jgi:hypothetical protein